MVINHDLIRARHMGCTLHLIYLKMELLLWYLLPRAQSFILAILFQQKLYIQWHHSKQDRPSQIRLSFCRFCHRLTFFNPFLVPSRAIADLILVNMTKANLNIYSREEPVRQAARDYSLKSDSLTRRSRRF